MRIDPRDLTHPAAVLGKLAAIENDLANRQLGYETAASEWFAAKRDQGRDYARALLLSEAKSITEKKADADLAAYETEGAEHEAEYEATRAVIKVLEQRAMILMSILKAQGRV